MPFGVATIYLNNSSDPEEFFYFFLKTKMYKMNSALGKASLVVTTSSNQLINITHILRLHTNDFFAPPPTLPL